MIGHCKDCRYWREVRPQGEMSYACHRDEKDGCLFNADFFLLRTDPMFGCVQFEEKLTPYQHVPPTAKSL